ncbi:hypothetical protein BDFB_011411 [Asbolus verrucosus]|uniref:Uncharacterized protein n=1 Tax=Asbolus verrucosus TaxID=1661398 RepID=A0A482VK30_ASBVE|nr:hypothetical protein BDFB_011411 [Asbolus verrucosus]
MANSFKSILPNFNPNQIPPNLLEPEEDGAAALPFYGNDGNNEDRDLKRSVASLVGAMRDLLNNIRPEMEVPNNADVDEDYDDLT